MSFLSTVTVFGTPNDVTLSELALEMLFPADDETAGSPRRWLRSRARRRDRPHVGDRLPMISSMTSRVETEEVWPMSLQMCLLQDAATDRKVAVNPQHVRIVTEDRPGLVEIIFDNECRVTI